MDFIIGEQHLRHSRSLGVMAAFSGVQPPYRLHLILTQFKIKDVDISCDPLRIRGLRKYDKSILQFKSEDDLSRILSVFFCQPGNGGMGEQSRISVSQRLVRLDPDIILVKKRPQLSLL